MEQRLSLVSLGVRDMKISAWPHLRAQAMIRLPSSNWAVLFWASIA